MNIRKKLLLTFFILLAVVLASARTLWTRAEILADYGDPPQRQAEIVVSFTQYQWWLTRWEDNQISCTVVVEHEGLPQPGEVLGACGETLYEEWINTPPCQEAVEEGGITESCEGLYLFYVSSLPGQRTVVVDLPVPSVWLSLVGCTLTPPQNDCSQIPALRFTAEEPLPNEQITAIHVVMDGERFDCPGDSCEIPMQPTSVKGVEIEFWADSSYGDESEHFGARVRIVDAGMSAGLGAKAWRVDVLSTQFQGAEVSSCAAAWEAFLPLGGPPKWLSTPEDPEELASDTPFVFLAGQLIARGLVDASECSQEGLLANGAANMCGLEKARPLVNEWQDHFDQTILEVAQETSVPARLLKNLFAQESQFWPGEIISQEFGLGQLTELGADGPLLWNPSFFEQFCPLVLHEEACARGYAQLEEDEQAIVRGALASQTNSVCQDCEMGIDLTHADLTVELFAQTLLGNCEQVAYLVNDVTGESPGVVSTYEDLWRYTLANYNAGPGCLSGALQDAYREEGELTWQTVSSHMEEGCQGAITYVERVTGEKVLSAADFLPTATSIPPAHSINAAYPPPSELHESASDIPATPTPAAYP